MSTFGVPAKAWMVALPVGLSAFAAFVSVGLVVAFVPMSRELRELRDRVARLEGRADRQTDAR